MQNMTPGQWVGLGLGTALVAMIPFFGFLAIVIGYLYVAFSDSWKDHVLQNYAKGALINMAIMFVLMLLFWGSFVAAYNILKLKT